MKSAKTAAAKLAITTMPWCPTQNQAQGRKHKRTKSEPQGETSGESEKKNTNDAKPKSKKVQNSDLN
jgi:hypothetical protein